MFTPLPLPPHQYGPYPSNFPCTHFNGTNEGNAGDEDYGNEVLTCGEGGLRWDSWGRLIERVFAYYVRLHPHSTITAQSTPL